MAESTTPRAPLPPAELARYVIGGEENPQRALDLFETQGADIREAIMRLLGPGWDWSLAGRRVLDFGCGAGRVLRQFIEQAHVAELHGCDIDAACIAWLEEQLSPPVQVQRSGALPPLPYAKATFDAVWAIAVFGHLTDTWADWLLEIHRILAPNGLLVATVMGEACSRAVAGEPWDPDRIGMTVLGTGRPWHAGGPIVLHAEWWVRAHWGRAFDILSYEEGGICGQDALLMRRRDVELMPENLHAPEPGEPRELMALQHNLELVHRDHAKLNAAHDAYAKAYHEESEQRRDVERRLAQLKAHQGSSTPVKMAKAARRLLRSR